MKRLPPSVERRARQLFWDVDPSRIDPELHEDFVLGRLLTEGDWSIVRALRDEIGDAALADFVRRAPHRLDRRTRRFFQVVLEIPDEACTKTHFPRSSETLFAP